eukprot:365157-Chlamydomonas_euryale.AAC.34
MQSKVTAWQPRAHACLSGSAHECIIAIMVGIHVPCAVMLRGNVVCNLHRHVEGECGMGSMQTCHGQSAKLHMVSESGCTAADRPTRHVVRGDKCALS